MVVVIKEDTLEAKPLERFVFDFEWLIKSKDVPKPGDDFTCVSPLSPSCFQYYSDSSTGRRSSGLRRETWRIC